MTLQSLIELALRDVRKDLVLSFISGAIRYSEKEKEGIIFVFVALMMTCYLFNLFSYSEGIAYRRSQSMKSGLAAAPHS